MEMDPFNENEPDHTRPLSCSKCEIEAKGDYDADQNEDDDYMMMMTTTCIKMQQWCN